MDLLILGCFEHNFTIFETFCSKCNLETIVLSFMELHIQLHPYMNWWLSNFSKNQSAGGVHAHFLRFLDAQISASTAWNHTKLYLRHNYYKKYHKFNLRVPTLEGGVIHVFFFLFFMKFMELSNLLRKLHKTSCVKYL